MANTPAPFKQVDIKRAVKGALEGGLAIGRVEIDREGKIVMIANSQSASSIKVNDWD